jgi:putative hydrolase of the HAD superfamily
MLSIDPPCGVILDGDDTLWRTEPLYDEAREHARAIVAESGLNGAEWDELQRRIDVDNVEIFGYSPERFPTSCVQAYERLCRRQERIPDPNVILAVRVAARAVFDRDPELVRGAREMLVSLKNDGARLALLTKGDYSVQRQRVYHSGLTELFDIVRIVTRKSAEEIRTLVGELRVPRDRAWMVGNSVRSDVLPALEAGIHAIWIRAHVWEYERAHDHLVDDRVTIVTDISEIPGVLDHAADAHLPGIPRVL